MISSLIFLAVLAAEPVAVSTQWKFRARGKDPITDLESSIASVKSAAGQDTLTVQCDTIGEALVSVLYIPKKFTGSSGSQRVTFRFDGGEPLDILAEPISEAKAVTDIRVVRILAHLLAKSQSVFVRAYDYNDQPVDSKFEIGGGESTIKRIFETCKVPYELPPKPTKEKKRKR